MVNQRYMATYTRNFSLVSIDFTTPSPPRSSCSTRFSSSYSKTPDSDRSISPCLTKERGHQCLISEESSESEDEEEGYTLKSWGEISPSHPGYMPGRLDALTPPIDYHDSSYESLKPTQRSIVIKRPMPRSALRASTLKSRIWVDPSFEKLLNNLKGSAMDMTGSRLLSSEKRSLPGKVIYAPKPVRPNTMSPFRLVAS